MTGPPEYDVNVEEIMQKIKAEVARRKRLAVCETREERAPMPPRQVFRDEPSSSCGFLWKFGTRYASLIKKIPLVREVAERWYWRLAERRPPVSSGPRPPAKADDASDFLETHANYEGFLEQAGGEGIKGRVKLSIFRFIGFFAWWQGQINRALLREITGLRERLERRDRMLKGLMNQRQELMSGKVDGLRADMDELYNLTNVHSIKMLDQQHEVNLIIDEVNKRLSGSASPGLTGHAPEKEDSLPDAMYAFFEDRFRGTRDEIKERLKVYLPYIGLAKSGTVDAPVVDLGCGRGEWLELLQEGGYHAKGVDRNAVMAERCRERGLDVAESDIIGFLRNQQADSFGMITGFHVAEHLLTRELIELLDESLRVLRPGGIMILETPNPENVIVGACNFYLDPTHRRPIPPMLLKFLVEARGFKFREIKRLRPPGEDPDSGVSGLRDETISFFTSEPDYSVIASKP